MHDPAISVIIPTFNSTRWVTLAVDSAMAQSLRPVQIIVVDDGSTDNTRQRLEGYAQHGVEYFFQENRGVAAARNAGIAKASGDLIAFLDADDVWHPRKLELQTAVFTEHPDLGLVGTGAYDAQSPCPPVDCSAAELPLRWFELADLLVKNYFATSSVVVRHGILDQCGAPPFDTALHGPEDYDLWLRIAERAKTARMELPLFGYHSVPGSLGKQPLTMEAGGARILRKLDERSAWDQAGGWILRRKAYAHFRMAMAYLYMCAGNHGAAMLRLLRSMAGYPLPFRGEEAKGRLMRPKMLGLSLLRLFGLKEMSTAEIDVDSPITQAGERRINHDAA